MKKTAILSPDLLSEIKRQPQQFKHVLISCKGNLKQTQSALEKAEITIEGQLTELNILKAKINFEGLQKLEQVKSIEWIEADEEIHLD